MGEKDTARFSLCGLGGLWLQVAFMVGLGLVLRMFMGWFRLVDTRRVQGWSRIASGRLGVGSELD